MAIKVVDHQEAATKLIAMREGALSHSVQHPNVVSPSLGEGRDVKQTPLQTTGMQALPNPAEGPEGWSDRVPASCSAVRTAGLCQHVQLGKAQSEEGCSL